MRPSERHRIGWKVSASAIGLPARSSEPRCSLRGWRRHRNLVLRCRHAHPVARAFSSKACPREGREGHRLRRNNANKQRLIPDLHEPASSRPGKARLSLCGKASSERFGTPATRAEIIKGLKRQNLLAADGKLVVPIPAGLRALLAIRRTGQRGLLNQALRVHHLVSHGRFPESD